MPDPQLIYIGKGQSLFSFVEKYCRRESATVHRLCSLMRKMDVQTIIVEDILVTHPDISAEYEALRAENHDFLSTYRLTFLSDKLDSLAEVESNQSFLASAYIINFQENTSKTERTYVYKAVVTLPETISHTKHGAVPVTNNYIHIFKNFECEVGFDSSGSEYAFNLKGTYFCQQNGVTSACAHVALCMVLNNLDTKIFDIEKNIDITPTQINEMLDKNGIPFDKSKEGLSSDQLKCVLNELNINYVDYDFITDPYQNPKLNYNDWIYNYIESRFPVLLGFNATNIGHIVPVIGHTLNPDLWKPEAENVYTDSRFNIFEPTSAWVDNLIIHDDNFGLYLHLSADALKRVTLFKFDPSFRATYGLALLPNEVKTYSKLEAESACLAATVSLINEDILSGNPIDDWILRLLASLNNSRAWVVRTLLADKKSFVGSLKKENYEGKSFMDSDIEAIGKNLPQRFWLSEITLPDLYTANQTKIIDFFYPCSLPPIPEDDPEAVLKRWIQVRFPGRLIIRDDIKNEVIPLSVGNHFPLFNFIEESESG